MKGWMPATAVLDEILDTRPMTEEVARNLLARFLFIGRRRVQARRRPERR